jgi:hypothetical protein
MEIAPFEFAPGVHIRRHGPSGYQAYHSYRDWLRDEFCFRCVFCLKRELWGIRLGSFHIDHFIPQVIAPQLGCTYDNLLYLCATCNSVKNDLEVPDPCSISLSDCLRFVKNGEAEWLNEHGELIVELLHLNAEDNIRFRKMIFDTLNGLRPEVEDEILFQWLGFPTELPNLSRKRTENTRPEGIKQSYYERMLRGELPSRY